MQSGRGGTYVSLVGFLVVVGLLCLVAAELHGIESKLVMQGQQIRALGEATDRLSAQRLPAASQGATAPPSAADEQPDHVLHPDAPNFLKPKAFHWPKPGASLDGVLRRGWPNGDLKGFNPLLEGSADILETIGTLCGASIADRNAWTNPDEWYGSLATRVEVTDDSKEFTVYLRKHLLWHAPLVDLNDPKYAWLKGNHEVTAQDFVFALDMIVNPQVQNGWLKSGFDNLESYKAIDDKTLVIRWKTSEYLNLETTLSLEPIPRFLFAYDEDGKPLPKETLGLRFNQHWYNNKGYLGAGPYRMVSYEPGNRMRMERFEDYFGEKPAIKEITWPIYTDPNQTLLKLKAHEVSIGVLTPGQYREEVRPYENSPNPPKNSPFFDGRLNCGRAPRFGYYYIGWNADRPLFADKRIRRAMTYALNRVQLIDSVFAGLATISDGPFQAGSPANDPSIKPIPFDLGEARKLLESAGWKDTDGDGILDKELRPGDQKRTPFEFTLLTYGSSKEYTALANVFKEDLLKIGVKLDIDAAEWSLMQKRMEEKNFDAFTGGWGTTWENDLHQVWHSSQADVPHGSNMVGFRNKRADAIIDKLRVTFDKEERLKLFREFHRLVDDEQPYTFLFSKIDYFCAWNEVKDVVVAKVRPALNMLPWSVAEGAQ
ncbi:MAG TPA: ABC transporter substrate-binding protein [Polyangiaceae bacterium]|nr:ABC transporter substrate-binding protein [Polyangiaceae bacterium]